MRTVTLFYESIEIVLEHRNDRSSMLTLHVSEPIELARRYVQPLSKIARCTELWNFQV